MWVAHQLRSETKNYSFTSSGQGEHADVALLADDTQFVNMLRSVEWERDLVQVQICDHCGYSGCNPGGYVSVRTLGNYIALVPSLKAYGDSAGSWGCAEYSVPPFIRRRGALLIRQDDWLRLAADVGLPSPMSFGPLSWGEALVAAQFETTEEVFSKPGTPFETSFRGRLLATDPYLSEQEMETLMAPQQWGETEAAARLVEPDEAVPITLVLDDPFVQVAPFVRTGATFGLMFAPGIVIAPA